MKNTTKRIFYFLGFILVTIMSTLVISSLFQQSDQQKLSNRFLISKQFLPPIQDRHRIPHILHLTYANYEKVPSKVWDTLQTLGPEYMLIFYDDDTCKNFLKTYFKPEVCNKYLSMRSGPHKADLFRYCLLYVYGGIYFDIKIKPEVPLNQIFDHNKVDVLYTVLSQYKPTIFQGVIATYPRNDLFLTLIDQVLKTNNFQIAHDYHLFTRAFYNTIVPLIPHDLEAGENYLNENKGSVVLLEELNKRENNEAPDKWKGYYGIYRNKNDNLRLLKTRYSDYPW